MHSETAIKGAVRRSSEAGPKIEDGHSWTGSSLQGKMPAPPAAPGAFCWDRVPQPPFDTSILMGPTGLTWMAFMTRAAPRLNEWAPVPSAANCSFFDNTPWLCGNYTWRVASPLTHCCSCGGGTMTLGPSPPSPPTSPLPPSLPCHTQAVSGSLIDDHLLRTDNADWVVGYVGCDYFSTPQSFVDANSFVPGAHPCTLFKWQSALPTSLCCGCRGGTFTQPLPPPSPPRPPTAGADPGSHPVDLKSVTSQRRVCFTTNQTLNPVPPAS
jgi:hypothetical protein